MTFVKICGVRQRDALEVAIAAGADAVGFVFDPASRRYVSPGEARALVRVARGRVLTVGVFVTDDAASVGEVVAEVGLDAVQWSGGLPRGGALWGMPSVRHIAVHHIAPGAPFPDGADGAWAHLVDAAGAPGGSGRLANWPAARQGAALVPLILAGGLTPQNVAEAIRDVRPFGVDVSSGVETDGEKDLRKISEFIRAVRQA